MTHPSQALELIPAKDTSPVGLGWWFMSKRAFRYKISCKSGSEIRAAENGVYGQSGGDKRDKRASRINGNKRVINGK